MSSFSAPPLLHLLVSAAEFIPSSHPRNDLVSSEDLAEETAISREVPVSIKEAVIESIRRLKNQTPELLHPTAQEDSFRNAALQSEEMIELTPGAGRSQGRGEKPGKALSRKKQGLHASLGEIDGVRRRKEAAGGSKN